MDIEAFFEGMPFASLLGIDVTDCEDGHAEGRLEMSEDLSWNEDRLMAHGGVTFTLADTVGGAALVSLVEQPVPTIDMRIDYLNAGTGDLYAEADVVRCGSDVGVVDVDVYAENGGESPEDADAVGTHIADARGVYKTG
ncbi:thioesterase superfamily protein [Haloterrigena turkmenica DSM 5511]|uniref:Thioesterase superfamily protein n=1 Tax=Haloterrigena turkmenica (strain ATCC 51198 / DSM 5511 / JCM 9101 / NCIMB 13204 / VKM B-1734 / 4k) TaxID=543526 RepID=D2RY05_HALTV|nr:PaaI family thioesterase [Haloterrigena turkmenica]ADB61751.1 thioesterase superfamily protein [Haloterrigena turkmenica DSM 5511]